ncbi:MAG TPA: ABC transporter permease [Gemmatimonadales bacterium]|jgi:peptide/nickel transport system permease protein
MAKGLLLALVRGVTVVAGVVILTFVLLHLAPGDPATRLLGPAATDAQRAALRQTLGLDRSLVVQLVSWAGRAVRGDFGQSIATGQPVRAMVAAAWPATAALVIVSLVLTYLFGVAIGVWQATMQSRAADGVTTLVTVALNALPGYWLALVLVMVFTYRLRWLPAFGAAGLDAEFLTPWAQVIDRLRHATLPLLTLTLIGIGGIARFVRASMRQVAASPFLTVACAKGLSPRRVTWRHQFRNAAVPVVTLLGLSLPALFSGTVFVEAVFAWPGVGQLMVLGVQARDYPVVMAAATISAVLVVVGNLAADLILPFVDPRTRQSAAGHD